MPPDELLLPKCARESKDFDDGQVEPPAFRSEDICGRPRNYVSVDREDMADRSVMQAISDGQLAKADAKAVTSESESKLKVEKTGKLGCGDIRRALVEKEPCFEVKPYPISLEELKADGSQLPEDPAHSGIENVSGYRDPKDKKNRAVFLEPSTGLVALCSQGMAFDEAYGG